MKGLLHHAAEKVLQRPECKLHCLPAAGGASGVGESIVAWAKRENADLVVVGSRGMGGAKSTLMSLVGLGSVSSYLLHHLHSPVAVVHGSHLEAEPKVLHHLNDILGSSTKQACTKLFICFKI